jgi:hypothetical protein
VLHFGESALEALEQPADAPDHDWVGLSVDQTIHQRGHARGVVLAGIRLGEVDRRRGEPGVELEHARERGVGRPRAGPARGNEVVHRLTERHPSFRPGRVHADRFPEELDSLVRVADEVGLEPTRVEALLIGQELLVGQRDTDQGASVGRRVDPTRGLSSLERGQGELRVDVQRLLVRCQRLAEAGRPVVLVSADPERERARIAVQQIGQVHTRSVGAEQGGQQPHERPQRQPRPVGVTGRRDLAGPLRE